MSKRLVFCKKNFFYTKSEDGADLVAIVLIVVVQTVLVVKV